MHRWDSSSPIYQQVGHCLTATLLGTDAVEGAPLPSVRELARTYMVHPLTIVRALDALRARGWIETRPGKGDCLRAGARDEMAEDGRKSFLADEWPALRGDLMRLGISASDLREDQAA